MTEAKASLLYHEPVSSLYSSQFHLGFYHLPCKEIRSTHLFIYCFTTVHICLSSFIESLKYKVRTENYCSSPLCFRRTHGHLGEQIVNTSCLAKCQRYQNHVIAWHCFWHTFVLWSSLFLLWAWSSPMVDGILIPFFLPRSFKPRTPTLTFLLKLDTCF